MDSLDSASNHDDDVIDQDEGYALRHHSAPDRRSRVLHDLLEQEQARRDELAEENRRLRFECNRVEDERREERNMLKEEIADVNLSLTQIIEEKSLWMKVAYSDMEKKCKQQVKTERDKLQHEFRELEASYKSEIQCLRGSIATLESEARKRLEELKLASGHNDQAKTAFEVEIAFRQQQSDTLSRELAKTSEAAKQVQIQLDHSEQELAATKQMADKFRQDSEARDVESKALRKQVSQLSASVDKMRRENTELQTQLEQARKEIEGKEGVLLENMSSLKTQIDNKQKELGETLTELKRVQDLANEVQKATEATQAQHRDELAQASDSNKALEMELVRYREQVTQANEAQKISETKLAECQAQLGQASERWKHSETRLVEFQTQLAQASEAHKASESKLVELQNQLAQANQLLTSAEAKLAECRGQRNLQRMSCFRGVCGVMLSIMFLFSTLAPIVLFQYGTKHSSLSGELKYIASQMMIVLVGANHHYYPPS